MSYGRVFTWVPDPADPLRGTPVREIVELEHLDATHGRAKLVNRWVRVDNWSVHEGADDSGRPVAVAVGNAGPDAAGNFLFKSRCGAGRIDRCDSLGRRPDRGTLERYIEASRFGEVNAYHHVTRIASYIDDLLDELGAQALPQVRVAINAHNAAVELDGVRDGVRGRRQWLPFQGGHYRLPGRRQCTPSQQTLSPQGEIHLGPGWRLLQDGALVQWRGRRYRAAASHNPGIIYHEYGHHICQHTADFNVNAARPPLRQRNRKSAIDEGTCDYWAAVLLGTPHIWIWHQRHDEHRTHPRSLVSRRTIEELAAGRNADPHHNGTIWAAALWDLRCALSARAADGARAADRLVLQALLLLREVGDVRASRAAAGRARSTFSAGLSALLAADARLHDGRHGSLITDCFARRKIVAERGESPHGPVALGLGERRGA